MCIYFWAHFSYLSILPHCNLPEMVDYYIYWATPSQLRNVEEQLLRWEKIERISVQVGDSRLWRDSVTFLSSRRNVQQIQESTTLIHTCQQLIQSTKIWSPELIAHDPNHAWFLHDHLTTLKGLYEFRLKMYVNFFLDHLINTSPPSLSQLF